MKLYHHTTIHALKNIIKDGYIYPVYDCVWLTTDGDGEMTAGMSMPPEHRGRICVEVEEYTVQRFNEVHEEFPHLNIGLLNMISDTSKWYILDEPLSADDFVSTDIIKDEKWINISKEKEI